MAFNRLIAVLPCYSLEDVSKELDENQIAEFHAAWTVLWHPQLLATAGGLPEWKRSDASSLDVENALVVMPSSVVASQDAPYKEQMVVKNCAIATANKSRSITLETVLEEVRTFSSAIDDVSPSLNRNEATSFAPLDLRSDSSSTDPSSTDRPLLDLHGQPKAQIRVEDFYALGLATLLVQALTRKIHYSSNLDIVLFAEQARSAAQAFIAREPVECERWLQSCFDQLSQERDRYFTQSANLIDLTLLANTTLQSSLDRQLIQKHPQNLLASAAIIERLSLTNSSALNSIRQRIDSNFLSIAGGAIAESIDRASDISAVSVISSFDYGWLPQESLYRKLDEARQKYLQFGISPPDVFAQIESGITWNMPTVLKNIGYKAALLHAFSDTVYPIPSQSKISWESSDNKTIDTVANGFVDASIARSVFSIIADLGKQFDYHQIPTLVFAHWPDKSSDAFNDLVTATRRTAALGQWSTLNNYFESTGSPYSSQRFTAAQFAFSIPKTRLEFLQCSKALLQNQQQLLQLESTRNMGIVTDLILRGKSAYAEQLVGLCSKASGTFTNTKQHLAQLRDDIGSSLANSIPRKPSDSSATHGFVMINPLSGPQRVYLSAMQAEFNAIESQRIYASHTSSDGTDMIVDLPPMGVLQLIENHPGKADGTRTKVKSTQGPLIGSSSWLLANEFIECQVDPKCGYLRSLMVARKRGGKLSGMPAIAIDKPTIASMSQYAVPCNVSNRYVFNSQLRATIATQGDLVLEGKRYGAFAAHYTLWRGARHLDISISFELDLSVSPSDNDSLWQLAPVWRTAWPSPTTTISTWFQGARTKAIGPKSNGHQFFAPELIELDDAEHRLYLTTLGTPIHRRVDALFLDTLVSSTASLSDDSRSSMHQFRLGMDWPRPYQTFLESSETHWMVHDTAGIFQSGGSAWMVQASQPNVRVVCCQLLSDSDSNTGSNRKPVGIRTMIQETQGKSTNCKLSFYCDAITASKVQIDGSVTQSLTIECGEVQLPMTANECSFVDVRFQSKITIKAV